MEISLKIAERLFNLNLQTDSILIPEPVDYPKLELLIRSDSLEQLISDHPQLILNQINTSIADKKIKWEKATLSPSVYAGYFNQQIDGIEGMDGIQLGVSIPLFFWAQKGVSQAAKINADIANQQFQEYDNSLKNEINVAIQSIRKQQVALDYYETTGYKLSNRLFPGRSGIATVVSSKTCMNPG